MDSLLLLFFTNAYVCVCVRGIKKNMFREDDGEIAALFFKSSCSSSLLVCVCEAYAIITTEPIV